MSAIPIDVQRRFEQKWASRFALPVVSTELKSAGTKTIPAKSTGRPAARQRPKKRPPA
jgi:hypothetical protein